jgi:hypothetical protein
LRQTRGDKKIPKTVLKTILKIKKKHIYFNFVKYLVVSCVSEIFIEDYLRNLTCWEKSKIRFELSASKLSKKR